MAKTKEVKTEAVKTTKAFNNFGLKRAEQKATNDLYYFEIPKNKINSYCSEIGFNSKLPQQFREKTKVFGELEKTQHVLKASVGTLFQALIVKATKAPNSNNIVVNDFVAEAIIEKLNRMIPNLNLTIEQYKAMV